MTEESKISIRASKIASIILALHELYGLSMPEATEAFYTSATSDMIEQGIADLQCRSNKYLATLAWEEYLEKHKPTVGMHLAGGRVGGVGPV